MFDVFNPLKSFLKVDKVCIDNNVFRLHYKVTVIFLTAFSILVTSSQYFGNPIDCIQRDDIPQKVIDTYCWIHATFTLPEAFDKRVGIEVPHPGVDKYKPGEQRIYHKYYQWVCFVLFFQAIMFYIPRHLWKLWEGGRMKSIVFSLNLPVQDKKENDDQIAMLSSYLRSHVRLHNAYFFYFVFCEVLNFINVIIQVYLVDAFLGGAFRTYGLEVLKFTEMDQNKRTDPMVKVFPRITKCTFHRFGPSGDVQRHDALCILPLNIINEKIYVFLWFWMVLLVALSSLILAYRICVLFCPNLRFVLLKRQTRVKSDYKLRQFLQNNKVGDWFVLYMLAKNISPINFDLVMEKVYSPVKGNDEKKPLMDDSEKNSEMV